MTNPISTVDPDGLLEYSVVFTDRSLNHMSVKFQAVMRDLNQLLCETYNGHAAVIVPGGGTYGMEAVARQFATDKDCLIIRNGFFSYRWSQIFEMGRIPARELVLKARQNGASNTAAYSPPPIDEVIETIRRERPNIVFAPHVETSAGMMLPDDYLKSLADAIHEIGGLFVLDCIASGAMWVDMQASGVDVLITAPQKGWSASPSAALVILSKRARAAIDDTTSTSFACDLKKWLSIMEAYTGGGHAYHATMPTDALTQLRATMQETKAIGLNKLKTAQQELGTRVRAALTAKGFASVAAVGYEAPGVIVSYTENPEIKTGKAFATLGLQTAAGVPLMCDEPASFSTFRLGLFGLDKLTNVDRTVASLDGALEQLT